MIKNYKGLAIPALVSRFIAAVLILILAFNKNNLLYIEKSLKHRFNWKIIKRILGIGVPYGLENSLFYLGRIFILGLVSTFGTAAIAANAVGGILAVFEVLPGMAINLGLTVIISRCVGKNDFEQAKYYNKKIILWVYLANVIMNLVILASLPWIMKVYGFSSLAASLTTELAVWHGVVAILIWPLAYTLPVTFRASGDAKYPMNISIITMFLCRVVMAYVLGSFFHLAVLGTWIAMFLDWIVKAVCFIYRYFSKKWMNYRAV